MFPPVELANEDGLLCWGGELSLPVLREAYRKGIFPWPHPELPLLWFAPPLRALLFLKDFHLGSRSRRSLKKQNFEIRCDTCFSRVLEACGAPRWYQGEWITGTWITREIAEAYQKLHRAGEAHSVEAWLDGELVGGLYGVSWGAYFCGESMFHTHPGASKAALAWLVERGLERGAGWIDCQLMTPHFQDMGARDVPRSQFQELLAAALASEPAFFDGN
jgi:leucyl/phenylalanyl-tRNA--protein transferase